MASKHGQGDEAADSSKDAGINGWGRFAGLVGIHDDLPGINNDIQEMQKFLESKQYDVRVLNDSAKKVDKGSILDLVRQLAHSAREYYSNKRKSPSIVFYFSGHGERIKKDGQPYYAVDTTEDVWLTAKYIFDSIDRELRQDSHWKSSNGSLPYLTCIFDTCYSAPMRDEMKESVSELFEGQNSDYALGVNFYGARYDKPAEATEQGSLFTEAVIETLEDTLKNVPKADYDEALRYDGNPPSNNSHYEQMESVLNGKLVDKKVENLGKSLSRLGDNDYRFQCWLDTTFRVEKK